MGVEIVYFRRTPPLRSYIQLCWRGITTLSSTKNPEYFDMRDAIELRQLWEASHFPEDSGWMPPEIPAWLADSIQRRRR